MIDIAPITASGMVNDSNSSEYVIFSTNLKVVITIVQTVTLQSYFLLQPNTIYYYSSTNSEEIKTASICGDGQNSSQHT